MIPLRDSQSSGRIPFITLLFIVINIYVFYLEYTTADIETFFARYALIPALVDFNDPVTLIPFVTSTFLHGGIIHLASNMWFLWIFGDNVEERLGIMYLPVYLLGGIIGGLAQYYFMSNSTIPIVGASGSVATVLGAYFLFFPRNTVLTLVPIFFFFTVIEIPAFAALGYWLFIQLFNGSIAIAATSVTQGGVAYFAHIGGFVTGMLVALIYGGNYARSRNSD